jgi:hypothetical protein
MLELLPKSEGWLGRQMMTWLVGKNRREDEIVKVFDKSSLRSNSFSNINSFHYQG